jgi:NADP-dependent 3-hydroxy acid dehydrogenase YdfG
VLVGARDPAAAAAAVVGLSGVAVLQAPLDVADAWSVGQAVAAVRSAPGRLEVLVNNAAAFVDWAETATAADLDAAHQVMEVNLSGAWRLTQALLPLLRISRLSETPVLVNAVCPGLTATYPGAEAMGAIPVQEGARSVIWAVTLPDNGPRGGFFRDAAPVRW